MGILVGRQREQQDLLEWCHSPKAELVCVYGRRRVGKTYLVENTFRNRLTFSVTGSEDKKAATQLRVFQRALKRHGAQARPAPEDWFDAFDRLRDLLEAGAAPKAADGRQVVFLDEFPWLAGKRSGFLVAFADFWNSWASKRDNLMVIICGSATSWVVRNLFENTGSMYNRITRRLYVPPFDLRETRQMAGSMELGWSDDTVLRAYLVFGGLPYYLDMLDRRLSLAQNVDALCLGTQAPLRDEVPHLMEATLSDSPLHRGILRHLSRSKQGVHRTDLASRLGSNGGGIKRALDDLEKCGYIRKYRNPYEKYRPAIYQLADPFLLFAFRFMDDEPLASWADFEGTPAYYAWRGNAFEMACLSHVAQIKRAIGVAAVQTQCFPWTSTGPGPKAQVDLVIERKDGVTDLCEAKFTDSPLAPTQALLDSMRRKRDVFRSQTATRNAVHLVLVSAAGTEPGSRFEDVAATVTAADLFQ